jgi:hypothetical protein
MLHLRCASSSLRFIFVALHLEDLYSLHDTAASAEIPHYRQELGVALDFSETYLHDPVQWCHLGQDLFVDKEKVEIDDLVLGPLAALLLGAG